MSANGSPDVATRSANLPAAIEPTSFCHPIMVAFVIVPDWMARTLNFRLVAEQVEDVAALEAARAMGIDFVQGHAIGRPRPLAPAA